MNYNRSSTYIPALWVILRDIGEVSIHYFWSSLLRQMNPVKIRYDKTFFMLKYWILFIYINVQANLSANRFNVISIGYLPVKVGPIKWTFWWCSSHRNWSEFTRRSINMGVVEWMYGKTVHTFQVISMLKVLRKAYLLRKQMSRWLWVTEN